MTYKGIRKVGEPGGFGQVYECEDETGNKYALKKLISNDEQAVLRFEREIRLMKRLSHPNVISVIAYNVTGETKFYIMPLFKGNLIEEIPKLENDYARQYKIISSILSGVQYLHSMEVLHRDLKPGNILYNNDDNVVITDLGFGIQLDSDSDTLTRMMAFGTNRYCSPEQRIDSHNVDVRTDIYALGKIIEDIITNFGKNSDYNHSFDFLIEKCTKNKKEDRFESIAELKKYLDVIYKTVMGLNTSAQLEEDMFMLAIGVTDLENLRSIATRVDSSNDNLCIEEFFETIDSKTYEVLEYDNLSLMRNLVSKLYQYYYRTDWGFNDIDNMADNLVKIFKVSKDSEIRADVLYLLVWLSIYYNRFYAMGEAGGLLTDKTMDIPTQTAFVYKLNHQWINIDSIVSVQQLPSLIATLFDEN